MTSKQIVCDAHGCRFEAISKRLIGGTVVQLCKNHAHVLEVKAKGYVWNKAVLEWLLETPPNIHKTTKFPFRNRTLIKQ